ncbi:putative fatty-acid-CoA ligase FadD [Streptomyces melanogenes]|nr:putative fatty-acid-CoA ligase FadD [Streptomyces melanogenes]
MTVTTTSILMPPHLRARIAGDPAVGAGNVLRTALETSPAPEALCLTAERPVTDTDGSARTDFSLRAIDALVEAWSCHYSDRGVMPRDRVAVWVDDSFEDQLHYFALSRIGAIAVLINGGLDADVAAGLIRRTAAVGVHTDERRRPLLERALDDDAAAPRWIHTADLPNGYGGRTLPASARYRHADADPVLICHSSGTTGVPKPVVWTHGQAMAGIRHHLPGFLEQKEARLLSALPQSHASAVGYTCMALLAGVPLTVLSGRGGAHLARAIDTHLPTTVVAFAGSYAELATLPEDPGPLTSVQTWISIGDASHQAHIKRLTARGSHLRGGRPHPGSMFVDGFGASELGWGGVLGQVTVPGTTGHSRCIGRPQPYADIAVLRADGSPAEDQEVGLLGVKGPTITPGYWGDSDTTYRSQLAGYWLSGDLVYRDRLGRFHHVDRAVDAISTPTGPGYSILMEEVLLAHLPDVDDCAVVEAHVNGGPAAVALVTPRGALQPNALERANEALRAAGQPEIARLTTAEGEWTIPFGATGKVLKRRLRERLADALVGPAL